MLVYVCSIADIKIRLKIHRIPTILTPNDQKFSGKGGTATRPHARF